MRTFDKTYNSFISNVLSPKQQNADIFIHTWETIGSPGSKLGSDEKISNTKTETILPQINNIIAPKKINIESYEVYKTLLSQMNNNARLTPDDRNYLHNKDLIAYSSMLYGWKQVGIMLDEYEKENNFEYDIVIRVRPDLLFTNKIYIYDWNMSSLHIPVIGKYYNGGMNDQFAISNGKNIRFYLNLFDHVVDYINRRECLIRPEVLLRHHLIKNGVSITTENIQFNIIRPDGRITTQTSDGQYWSK